MSEVNRIRELRGHRAWSAEELATRAGTTGATISRLEIGKMGLTTEWLNRIAAALEVRPTDLLEKDDDTVYVMVLGEMGGKYPDIPTRRDGKPMLIPAFHPALRVARLVAFSDGASGWIIGDALQGRHPSRFGSWSIVLIEDAVSLRTYDRSESGGLGYVAQEGDPAKRWISANDKRIRHVWRAVAQLKMLI